MIDDKSAEHGHRLEIKSKDRDATRSYISFDRVDERLAARQGQRKQVKEAAMLAQRLCSLDVKRKEVPSRMTPG
jgi:hypothetical protein